MTLEEILEETREDSKLVIELVKGYPPEQLYESFLSAVLRLQNDRITQAHAAGVAVGREKIENAIADSSVEIRRVLNNAGGSLDEVDIKSLMRRIVEAARNTP